MNETGEEREAGEISERIRTLEGGLSRAIGTPCAEGTTRPSIGGGACSPKKILISGVHFLHSRDI